jgi:pimeloyl-ACP methyl ester carboxylesterase
MLQDYLIFPGRMTQGQPSSVVRPLRGEQLIRLKLHDDTDVVAVYGPALLPDGRPMPDADEKPGMLFFYGNGMCAADFMDGMEDLRRLGVNVMLPDYPGYGMSGGSPSEQAFYEAGNVFADWLEKRTPAGLIFAGWSIGTGTAVELASHRPCLGLVLLSGFTSLDDLAASAVPWLPTGWILKHHFRNEEKLRSIAVPVFLAHGSRDEIIPATMSRRLAAAAQGPVTLLELPSVGHNDVFDPGAGELLSALRKFIESLPSSPPPDRTNHTVSPS